jgi:hypothetical protein
MDGIPVHGRQLGSAIREKLGGQSRRSRGDVVDLDHFDGGSTPGGSGKRRGVDRGDGRDDLGHFVGSENRPWSDKEKLGLEHYAADNEVDVITKQVKVDYDGSPQDGRRYDGLVKNDDGPNTYDGVEVKSGSALDKYARPGNTQYEFDTAVNAGKPAHGMLDGKEIAVTRVFIQEER